MKPEYPLHIPLAGTPAEAIFTRQEDGISCGPACLATVANIYHAIGLAAGDEKALRTYDDFRAAARPSEEVGTPEERIQDLCEKHLPYESAGASSYHGGVAIADIMQGGEGHYVVFLKQKDDLMLYYDPYEHELVIDKIAHVDWQSGFEKTKQWSVNFIEFSGNSFERWLDMAEKKPPSPPANRPLYAPH